MKRASVVLGCALVLGTVFIVFGNFGRVDIPVLDPAGSIALAERSVILVTFVFSSIVVVPVFVLLFWFAWKYRATNIETAHHHRPEWDHRSGYLEFAWWLVPSAIVAVLAVVAWDSAHALDPYVPLSGTNAPITIEVVALDWKWLFIYPAEGIATVNEVEFPVGTPVHFELTADAPMNSFWVPALGGQIMVMPGMTTQLNLLANRAGIFTGVSGNISGAGFSGMTFAVHTVSLDEYDRWVEAIRRTSPALTAATYEAVRQPSSDNPIATYSPVDSALYTAITMKFMSPSMTDMNNMPGMPTNHPQ
ncbi:MAG TPA: ubiquinol oxidase subunit II [Candidatus Paceibacterota bacterium]|nr:ubiquinol oxidase subunit II [Candidatus Paceibacterota bacterium]